MIAYAASVVLFWVAVLTYLVVARIVHVETTRLIRRHRARRTSTPAQRQASRAGTR